jgi:hypothetical protein
VLLSPLHLRSLRAATALIAICALASCSSSHKHVAPPQPEGAAVIGHIQRLKVGTVDLETAGPPLSLPKKTQVALLAAAQQYVDSAVGGPLADGTVDPAFEALFDPSLRAVATTTDRATLTDAVVGRATRYSASAPPVAVSGLVDGSGALLYLATDFTLAEHATTPAGTFGVQRRVELTFAPRGNDWKVVAYRVSVIRTSRAGTTTTTVVSGSKP